MHDHWEGRQLKQTTCKHRVAAIALAAGGTLALAGGTAFASNGGHSTDPNKDPNSRDFGHKKNDGDKITQRGHSGASGFADVTQRSGVFNLSLGLSNSGLNHAGNSIDQSNGTGQSCEANTKGGNVLAIGGLGGRHDRHASDAKDGTSVQAGNQGGDCSNDASSDNTANPTVALTTGDASTMNDTSTTIGQHNTGGVDVSSSNDGSIDPSGHGDNVRQSGGSWADGGLSVDQAAGVANVSIGIANSGGNSAGNHISQSNDTGQDSSANTKGGNVLAIGGRGGVDVTTGNNGGSSSNKSSSSNTANPNVTLTTGNATASNKTSTNINQSNSGGVKVSSDNSGSVG
jgi:hypothetical protein